MHGHGPNTNFSGIRRMPEEIAKFLSSQDWLFGEAAGDKPRVFRRRLRIETLEQRHLMDAAAAASAVSSAWFQNIAGSTGPAHARVADWTIESTGAAAAQTATSPTAGQNVYDWIVQFDTASLGGISSVAQTASLLAGGGLQFQVIEGLGMTGMVLARSSGASLAAAESWLASDSNVASFEQDAVDQVKSIPSDPQYSQLWGMSAIDAPAAWNLTTGSQSVVVAVLDTGIDYTHCDLAANIWTNPYENEDGFVGDAHGYNFVDNSGDAMDDNSHGTHVSGTIGAVGNNGVGVAGVDWSVSLMDLKFLNSDGSGYLSDAIRAINYVTMMRTQYNVNVRVINNSWGGGEYSAAMDSAIRAAGNAGILFVAAAGNSASNNDTTPQYPASYTDPNVISVAAVDQNMNLASFSCYGATSVDVAAPGVSIYSTVPGNRYAIYSGTSMATPFVSGVAALAWAADPNATVAEVRNAILDGVTKVAALNGKVASGGVLNAYNTLELLGVHVPQGPVVGSLLASLKSVNSGAAVTLSAGGISDSSGTVTSVSFILDADNDGQYESGDTVLGSTSAISGGQASVTISTSGWNAGSYNILARAQDNSGVWSACVSTTLTVLPPDNYGNSAGTAATIGVPSSTAGAIETVGDANWFKFQAVAGKSYVFTVGLGTLPDSVLYLYDTNGAKQLAFNDDYGVGGASQIAWTAPGSGTYYVVVGGYGSNVGTYTLTAAGQDAAPVLDAIGNQTLPYSQTTLTIPLHASDADGDSLTYSVQVMTMDRLAEKAYALDQQLGLHTYANGSYYTNARGAGEKYLLGNGNGLYFLLPNGGLYRWGGSIAKSALVDTLSSAYYSNPALLYNAQTPSLTSISSASAAATISGSTLTITRQAGFTDVLCVQVGVSDGSKSDSETFTVADPFAQTAYDLDRQLGLHTYANGSYYANARGAGEKYLLGNGNGLYFLLPNGALYRWGGSIGGSTLVATLSPDYYANPALLYQAQSPAAVAAAAAAGSSSAIRAVENVGTRNVASSATEASAAAAMRLTDVAMAWLAREHGSRPDAAWSTSAVTIAPADALAALLHDEAFAGMAVADSQPEPELSLRTLDHRFGQLSIADRSDAESPGGQWDLIDSAFELPTEMLLPSNDWLA
jgi:subtilisin family serine protease